jgi:hypothetical protein
MQKFPKAVVYAVAGVLGINLLIFWFSGREPAADLDSEGVYEVLDFRQKAREECLEALKKNTQFETGGLYFKTDSDDKNKVTFTWLGDAVAVSPDSVWKSDQSNFKELKCSFEKGKGVVTIAADDKVVWKP